MFDFQKLHVYQNGKAFTHGIHKIIQEQKLNRTVADQLRRASLSIILNIAEGGSRFSKADKRNFYVIARGSAFECVAILEFLNEQEVIKDDQYETFYGQAEELSKMLFGLIKALQ